MGIRCGKIRRTIGRILIINIYGNFFPFLLLRQTFNVFGESLISEEEILQSCASASLSSKVFSQGSQIEEESEDPSTNQEFVDEEQFSTKTFQMALFTLSKESKFSQLQAL